MASLVHLVRHGEVENPQGLVYASLQGFGLSEAGRSQAAAAARHLGSQPVVAVWSSPLERGLETAGIIARRFGVPVRADDRLAEWKLLDRWAGKPWATLDTSFPGELEAYLEHPHQLGFSSESLSSLANRIRGTVELLAEQHRDGDIVIVSHQDPVQAARLSFAGRDLSNLHTDKPGHCSIVTLRPSASWADLGMWTPDQPLAEVR
jgi:broad specificity phosphatase PhoE